MALPSESEVRIDISFVQDIRLNTRRIILSEFGMKSVQKISRRLPGPN